MRKGGAGAILVEGAASPWALKMGHPGKLKTRRLVTLFLSSGDRINKRLLHIWGH